jgi:hypothetical protein
MCFLTSQKDKHRYLYNVIDAFSKYSYSVPICCKTDQAVALAFPSILARNCGRPLAVRTDKCKEFVSQVSQASRRRGHRNERFHCDQTFINIFVKCFENLSGLYLIYRVLIFYSTIETEKFENFVNCNIYIYSHSGKTVSCVQST